MPFENILYNVFNEIKIPVEYWEKTDYQIALQTLLDVCKLYESDWVQLEKGEMQFYTINCVWIEEAKIIF